MPGISCKDCGHETFVLGNPIGQRHCTQCGQVLPSAKATGKGLMDSERQQQIADAAATAAVEPKRRGEPSCSAG